MARLLRGGWPLLLLLPGALGVGCGSSQPPQPGGPAGPPEVKVSLPITRAITDYDEFSGRIAAVSSVEIRARVTGYLDKMHFKEGAEVKQGAVLFEIDPRPYQADLARAEANVEQAEAHLERLQEDYRRAADLLPRKAIGREEFDRIRGDRLEAAAAVGVARAQRDAAKLNLEFTKVTSPISGRISRRRIDPGNLVKADDTALTTIVSLDPMYAYFDVDERTVLRIQRLIQEGQIQLTNETEVPVWMGLADDPPDEFPRRGTINFMDNQVDPDTGTLSVRGSFPNPDRILAPGMFVRVKLPIGNPHPALLVAEQALGRDQGQKFLYVIKDTGKKVQLPSGSAEPKVLSVGKVEYRQVNVGRLHNGLRVITGNLATGEQVVLSGLQRVRPGAEVAHAEPVPMPTQESGVRSQEAGGRGQEAGGRRQ